MSSNTVSLTYQILYFVIPTISVIGNAFIVYATLVSKSLRNPCNIFIALIASGDVLLMFSFFTTIISYELIKDHQIRQDVCVYIHIIPVFGSCFSAMLVLNLAIDRLLSLTAFYELLASSYKKLYVMVQLLPACAFGAAIDVMIVLYKNDKKIVCTLAAPLIHPINQIYVQTIAIICVLLVICYCFFGLFLKKLQMSSENMKSVYRSLVVISLSIVFGNFSAMVVALRDDLGNPTLSSILLAGLLMNSATAINFFAYYLLSTQYREIFDRILGIGRLRSAVFSKKLATVQLISIRSNSGIGGGGAAGGGGAGE